MTSPLLNRQVDLPRSIPLFQYVPDRLSFSWEEWNPSLVRTAADLPQYLILGNLDPSTFQLSPAGWSARWQGTEDDTYFDVAYKAEKRQWEVHQIWCGLDGGFGIFGAGIPLNKIIGPTLYLKFPSHWDQEAKLWLESTYQITLVEQPEDAYTLCGIPDGAFRTIVFPLAVYNLRPVREWIQDIVDESPLAYPVYVEAKLIFQALNYLEGKAPEWTTREAVVFDHSVKETGLAPLGFPVREVASDGSAAWTLRREIYFLFIRLPFAGLTDFLSRMASTDGPICTTEDPDFRFELRPIVIPAGLELQTESMAFWDRGRTTRSLLQFALPGDVKRVPTIEEAIAAERLAPATLAKAEAISSDVVKAIDQILLEIIQGGGS